MRVLHYINNVRKGDLLSSYLSTLAAAQSRLGAVVSVVTRRDNFKAKLKEFRPDVVHIHSMWDIHVAIVAQQSLRKNCGVVLSPHGQLDAFRYRYEHRWGKVQKKWAYQRRMVTHVDALMATSDGEADRLRKLSWNAYIDVVSNCLLTSRITSADMAALSLRLYGKVIDTRYIHYMTAAEHEAVGVLLHTAIDTTPDGRLPKEKMEVFHDLDATSWRRMFLFAADEGVLSLVKDAIETLSLSVGPVDTAAIARYPSKHPKSKEALPTDKLLTDSDLKKEKWGEVLEKEDAELRGVVTLILNFRFLQRKGDLSMRHLCDLYTAIKYRDYDEDRLRHLLSRFSAVGYARGVIATLGSRLMLGEGFMPLPPKYGHRASSMMKTT